MDRRFFLTICMVGTASIVVAAPKQETLFISKSISNILLQVQQHMFPTHTIMPTTQQFGAAVFLLETMMHSTFDSDVRHLIIKGAYKLDAREQGNFLHYSYTQKETALRAFEETKLGKRWLDRVLTLTIEALLGDPIYNGNLDGIGWRWLGTNGGEPKTLVRYAGL